jgi:putative ABC transport system ATP-binding protein
MAKDSGSDSTGEGRDTPVDMEPGAPRRESQRRLPAIRRISTESQRSVGGPRGPGSSGAIPQPQLPAPIEAMEERDRTQILSSPPVSPFTPSPLGDHPSTSQRMPNANPYESQQMRGVSPGHAPPVHPGHAPGPGYADPRQVQALQAQLEQAQALLRQSQALQAAASGGIAPGYPASAPMPSSVPPQPYPPPQYPPQNAPPQHPPHGYGAQPGYGAPAGYSQAPQQPMQMPPQQGYGAHPQGVWRQPQVGPALVSLRGITKAYARGGETLTILSGLNLEVNRGAYEALMGPSGSGKSTLLNLIAGLDVPTSGEVLVEGKDIARMSETERAQWRSQNVGFIFQSYNLLPVLTAVQNVELPLLLTKLSKKERRQRAETALRIVGLEQRMGHFPRQLSGGQEQRVAIARAIVNDPALLVADEPTGDLDRASADAILLLLEKLNVELGKTIVMVTHDDLAARRAQTIRRLDKGQLVT